MQYHTETLADGSTLEAWAADDGGYVKVAIDGGATFQPCGLGQTKGRTIYAQAGALADAIKPWIATRNRLIREDQAFMAGA